MKSSEWPRSILAIDPGPKRSAWVVYGSETRTVREVGEASNETFLQVIRQGANWHGCELLAVEMVASYGMAVGADVFETVLWTGRFIEAWGARFRKVYRREVKLHLCGNQRAKDANVRQSLIDLYGPGKEKAVGTKKAPGPLYMVKSHAWSALAVAVTAAETEAA